MVFKGSKVQKMAKRKYIYDYELLTYIPVENTIKSKIKKILPYVFVGAAVGLASYLLLTKYHMTPEEHLQAQRLKDIHTRQEVLEQRIAKANSKLNDLVLMDDSVYRSIFGMTAISPVMRQAGTGGVDTYEDMIDSDTPKDIIEGYKHLDGLVAKMNVQKGSYNQLFKRLVANVDKMKHMPAIIPIANWDLRYIGSGFSKRRWHPILKQWRQHDGIDFVANVGKAIRASGDGVVSSARISSSFGKVVEIDHGYGFSTLYAHMSKIHVKRGQIVKRGEVIGEVGNTGLSAGAHLHYEVHVNGKPVDPVNYFFKDLTPEEYKLVVAQSQSVTETME